MELTWGATSRFRLTVQTAGPDVAGALDQLLAQWHTHLAAVPEAGADDTAAVVTWPSRDVGGPLAAAAARAGAACGDRGAARRTPGCRAGRYTAGVAVDGAAFPAPRRGVQIRRAGPADIDAVVRLGMETVRFDAHFGTVIERPWSAEALRREAEPLLAGPDAWTWLAEHDGEPAACSTPSRPRLRAGSRRWRDQMPVAYLELMYVQPGERGQGMAPALVEHLHREADAAGVAVTLLHYEQVNPLSGPFWNRQGYRPLWTSWEARPARTLR